MIKHKILLGKPCSGKGTVSKKYQKLGFHHLSGSDMLRDHIKDSNAKYYTEAKYALDNGIMIKDDIIIGIFLETLKTIPESKPIVLDGYPRSVVQSQSVIDALGVENIELFLIDVDDETCIERLTNRITCTGCAASFSKVGKYQPKIEGVCDHCGSELYVRPDDKVENFIKKIKEYDEKTMPILDYMISKGVPSKKFEKQNMGMVQPKDSLAK